MKDLFDKVLFGIMASLISTYALYNYNIYSKAVEDAQSQSRPYSKLAAKLYDSVVDDLTTLMREIKIEQLSGQKPLSEKNRHEMLRFAGEINIRANSLKSRMPNASSAAQGISDALRETVPQFDTPPNFNRDNVDGFNQDIIRRQADFIDKYSMELGAVSSKELVAFEESFARNVPTEAKPSTLLLIAIASIGVYGVYLIALNLLGRKVSAEES